MHCSTTRQMFEHIWLSLAADQLVECRQYDAVSEAVIDINVIVKIVLAQ